MKKDNEQKEHPEVADIKNICDVAPKTKITKDVCEKINNEKIDEPNQTKTKQDEVKK